MPTSMARLDAITFGEGDYDLQTEMTLDLARLKVCYCMFCIERVNG